MYAPKQIKMLSDFIARMFFASWKFAKTMMAKRLSGTNVNWQNNVFYILSNFSCKEKISAVGFVPTADKCLNKISFSTNQALLKNNLLRGIYALPSMLHHGLHKDQRQ